VADHAYSVVLVEANCKFATTRQDDVHAFCASHCYFIDVFAAHQFIYACVPLVVGVQTVRIFSDHIRDRIRLEEFRSVRI
jgi:hypothetical protein